MTVQANRQTLDNQLKKLNDEILVLGSMVEQAVLRSVEALKKRDLSTAERIRAGDLRINQKHFQIEQDALITIATQQPIARDLRILASIMDVNTELERMGDYAKGIARITMELSKHPPIAVPDQLTRMAAFAVEMLKNSLTAFVAQDEAAARAIPDSDDVVDAYYNEVNRLLIALVGENAASIDRANYLMWAAHNLERLADRVTNICERTLFIATGKLVELDVPDSETSFN